MFAEVLPGPGEVTWKTRTAKHDPAWALDSFSAAKQRMEHGFVVGMDIDHRALR
jgi:hypothetical protein